MNVRLIIVALVVIAIAVAAALLLPSLLNTQPAADPTPAGQVGQEATTAPNVPTNTPRPVATEIPTTTIIVAVQPIGRGQEISPDLVDFRTWPVEYAPISALSNPEDVIGKIARVDIFREQPILTTMITENLSELGAVGSDAGALLPQGTRLVAVPMDRITSVAYAIQPGDRVDIIVSMLFVDVDPDFQTLEPNTLQLLSINPESGTLSFGPEIDGKLESRVIAGFTFGAMIGPSEQRRPRLATQMTVQDALVVYVGDFPEDGRIFQEPTAIPVATVPVAATPGATGRTTTTTQTLTIEEVRPDLVSLAVTPQEAVVLTYFIENKLPMTFALRPANEIGTSNVEQVNLEYVMNTYRIELPRKIPYSVEPAIRSIRQLIAGEVIELSRPVELQAETTETTN